MRTIWKYTLDHGETVVKWGEVRHVGVDPADLTTDLPAVWVEHDTADGNEMLLTFIGTGMEVPKSGMFVGSCITVHGLVWHVFKVG